MLDPVHLHGPRAGRKCAFQTWPGPSLLRQTGQGLAPSGSPPVAGMMIILGLSEARVVPRLMLDQFAGQLPWV
jgi:hypothetical protein